MIRKIVYTLATTMLLAIAGTAQASPYGFTVVEDNSSFDPSMQLRVDVTDGDSGPILFKFTNEGSIQSHIGDIYFDWGTGTALTFAGFSSTGEVSFSADATPGNLPGGNNISFIAGWSADPNPPPGTNGNGIDNWSGSGTQDTLTIAFTEPTFGDIISALNDGTYRIGLHLQGLTDGKSESYVNGIGTNPVPAPATILLFGTGLAALAGIARKKHNA
ncbi:MAG: PEP-CTERM sorting domain-containing protein [Desulfobulbaceae bacterium]|nr:PEP-CTERM sorting domain-containing protein [Desulfobulbaceae bacterium]